MFEVRYRGHRVSEHATEQEATQQIKDHHSDIQDQDEIYVVPSNPVRLYCRGVLVDTFESEADARAHVEAHATEETPKEAYWWGGPHEVPENPHEIWPIEVRELDTSDEATVWAEGQRPAVVNKSA